MRRAVWSGGDGYAAGGTKTGLLGKLGSTLGAAVGSRDPNPAAETKLRAGRVRLLAGRANRRLGWRLMRFLLALPAQIQRLTDRIQFLQLVEAVDDGGGRREEIGADGKVAGRR